MFVTINVFSCGAQQPGLQLKITMKRTIANKQDDLLVKLILTNNSSAGVLIHKYISFQYLSGCMDDLCFEAEKNTKGGYKKMEELANIDKIPGFDSTGVAWDDMYDTLQTTQKFSDTFNINGYYSFTKGRYRVRLGFRPYDDKKSKMKMVYSNWLYFEVKVKHIKFYLENMGPTYQ